MNTASRAPLQTGQSFSLATLLLAMTLACVWLALLARAPVFAALSFFPLAFATLRCWVGTRVRRRAGIATSASQKIELFLASGALGLLICFLSFVVGILSFSFLGLCAKLLDELSAGDHASSFAMAVFSFLGMLICVLASQLTAIYFIWTTWPRRYDPWEDKFQ